MSQESTTPDIPTASRVINLGSGPVPIGRASAKNEDRASKPDNLYIRNSHVSKAHARVWMEQGKVFLEDLGSTFGTIHNNYLLGKGARAELEEGDTVGLVINRPAYVIKEFLSKNGNKVALEKFLHPRVQVHLAVRSIDTAGKSLVLLPLNQSSADASMDVTYVDDVSEEFLSDAYIQVSDLCSDNDAPLEEKITKEVVTKRKVVDDDSTAAQDARDEKLKRDLIVVSDVRVTEVEEYDEENDEDYDEEAENDDAEGYDEEYDEDECELKVDDDEYECHDAAREEKDETQEEHSHEDCVLQEKYLEDDLVDGELEEDDLDAEGLVDYGLEEQDQEYDEEYENEAEWHEVSVHKLADVCGGPNTCDLRVTVLAEDEDDASSSEESDGFEKSDHYNDRDVEFPDAKNSFEDDCGAALCCHEFCDNCEVGIADLEVLSGDDACPCCCDTESAVSQYSDLEAEEIEARDCCAFESTNSALQSAEGSRKRSYDEANLETDERVEPEKPKRSKLNTVLREAGKGLVYVAGTLAAMIAYGRHLDQQS